MVPLFTFPSTAGEMDNLVVLVSRLRRPLRALLRSWRPAESVLLIPLPQLDSAVGDLRSRHDPSAAAGVPPHITLVYPFLPPRRLRAAELRALQEVFSQRGPVAFDLVGVCGFPGVVYLAPDPARPLVELVESVWARFPEAPPYGGVFPQIVPHLTVAMAAPDAELDAVLAAAAAALPIRCVADEAWLMVRRARWQLRARFPLGTARGQARVPALAGVEWT